MGQPKPSRETKFSGANEDREKFILPVQLSRSRIGNLTRLILTLATCHVMTIYTYIYTVRVCCTVVLKLYSSCSIPGINSYFDCTCDPEHDRWRSSPFDCTIHIPFDLYCTIVIYRIVENG